ncbi:MAG: membrane integrity-associated transporter subunit PqiC [Rhizobiales bacterium]|nr:membrane integrity-associated transporter subunit PqiC [Hyphomicrobiales bacterium]
MVSGNLEKASDRSAWARVASAALVALLVAGCGGGPPPATFDISAPREGLRARPGSALIVVAEPSALAALDTNRLIVMTRGSGIAYLPDAQWADRLPKLLQVRLIQTFENAKRITGVGRPGDRLLPAAQVNSEIRRFGIDEASGEAVIELSVKIVNDRSGRIVAGNIFTRRTPAGGANGPTAAAALDLATQEILRDIVSWVSSRI